MNGGRPVAVVTGASRGIGRAIATTLATRGADVVLAGRDVGALRETEDLVTAAGARSLVVPTDVTVEEDVRRLAGETAARFGRVDALVANSGVGGPSGPLWELEPVEWVHTFDVNVAGVFRCCRAFLPAMIARGSGGVIVIGSMTGKRPLWGRSPYAASKLALVGLVRTLALEAAPLGVRVNLISPGPVAGERIEWVFRAQAEGRGITVDEAREEMIRQVPIGRLVKAQEVADAVALLAFDGLPAVTGQDLNVSGGMVMY